MDDDDFDDYKMGIFSVRRTHEEQRLDKAKTNQTKANSGLNPNKRRSSPNKSPVLKKIAGNNARTGKEEGKVDQEAKLAQVLDKENVVLAVANTPHGTMLAVKSPVVYKYLPDLPERRKDTQYDPALPAEKELPTWIQEKIAHHRQSDLSIDVCILRENQDAPVTVALHYRPLVSLTTQATQSQEADPPSTKFNMEYRAPFNREYDALSTSEKGIRIQKAFDEGAICRHNTIKNVVVWCSKRLTKPYRPQHVIMDDAILDEGQEQLRRALCDDGTGHCTFIPGPHVRCKGKCGMEFGTQCPFCGRDLDLKLKGPPTLPTTGCPTKFLPTPSAKLEQGGTAYLRNASHFGLLPTTSWRHHEWVCKLTNTNSTHTPPLKPPNINNAALHQIPPSPDKESYAYEAEPRNPGKVIQALKEPLLEDSPNRFVLYPIKDHEIFKRYKQQMACFWTPEEIDLSQDQADWEALTKNERSFIATTLAFFAASDGIVNENLLENIMTAVKLPEARCFYSAQLFIENIHNEMYSILIDTYIKDAQEKDKLFNATANFPCIKKKADWALHFCNSPAVSFDERIVAFAAVEYIFFSSSFASIFYLKKRGIMPGLCLSNEFISRDEALHCQFACLIHSRLNNKISPFRIYQIVESAVDLEKNFAKEALATDIIGINSRLMGKYIEVVADQLLESLALPKKYHTRNPFEWMEMISLEGKTNFFEKGVSEYSKAGVSTDTGTTRAGREFELDEEF
jgi:ribonucleotide reductase beta subunit family protein with ferritin-like domain